MINPSDPVIDEIRELRHRISERCQHDPIQLVDYYLRLQEKYQDRLLKAKSSTEATDQSAA
jgi:hypothetical protein